MRYTKCCTKCFWLDQISLAMQIHGLSFIGTIERLTNYLLWLIKDWGNERRWGLGDNVWAT